MRVRLIQANPESMRKSSTTVTQMALGCAATYLSHIYQNIYDVKVKRYVKALSLVNVHKQLQGLCAAPKEMMRARYLGAGF